MLGINTDNLLEDLNNPDEIERVLFKEQIGQQLKKSVRKMLLLNVIGFLSSGGIKISEKFKDLERIAGLEAKDETYYKSPSKEETDAYISINRIKEIRDVVGGGKDPLSMHAHLLLSLYTFLPPLRGDEYCKTVLRDDIDTILELPDECKKIGKNILDTKLKRLAIAFSKTNKTYGTRIIEVPIPLIKIITNFSKKYNNTVLLPKLVHGKIVNTRMSENDLRLALNKSIGTTPIMLRKIYISEVVPNLAPDERKALARIMGHSLEMQEFVYGRFRPEIIKHTQYD